MKLKGKCNFCGLCCFSASGAKCENLQIVLLAGVPNGTVCTAYDKRYDGMPIRMLRPDGSEAEPGLHVCAKDSLAETLAIAEKGIGRGCSLTIE